MRILFQGDSITDAGRNRNDFYSLGSGYAKVVAEMLKSVFKDVDFEFINRGIGGNRTVDLVNRLQEDFIDINPDIMSLMIGINDVWRFYDRNDETTDEDFENNLTTVLTAVKEKTASKIILIEPFLIYGEAKPYREQLNRKIDIVRKLALKYADAYLALDGIMTTESVRLKKPELLAGDLVHPSREGIEIIAKNLTEVYKIFI